MRVWSLVKPQNVLRFTRRKRNHPVSLDYPCGKVENAPTFRTLRYKHLTEAERAGKRGFIYAYFDENGSRMKSLMRSNNPIDIYKAVWDGLYAVTVNMRKKRGKMETIPDPFGQFRKHHK